MRRATRHDLGVLRPLLPSAAPTRAERFDRRLLRHLGSDVYVAVADDGTLTGAVSLTFVRSFAAGWWRAYLDGAWVAAGEQALLDALVDFAIRRAERRHCHELVVLTPLEPALEAALERRGLRRETCWRTPVTPVVAAPAGRGRRRRS
jgi:hypothetical protein